MELQRYKALNDDALNHHPAMVNDASGDWVRFADVQALLATTSAPSASPAALTDSTVAEVLVDCEAFEAAMVEAGYSRPDIGRHPGMYRYQRDQDRFVGWRLARALLAAQPAEPFQARVQPWMLACFGAEIAGDKQERNHRFLEEALELVQACGATASEAHQLVDYVYGRPVGDKGQEAGGVIVTLAALCHAQGLDMHAAGETELARIWTMVEKIRAKQAAKPKHSPLPEHMSPSAGADDSRDALILDALKGAKSLLEELPAHEVAGTRTAAAYIAVCAALRASKEGKA
ncbi:hypothetical protein [Cupriavidus phytorum]|nr:hypothetical protein [Cupriavidus alkaliphilus]